MKSFIYTSFLLSLFWSSSAFAEQRTKLDEPTKIVRSEIQKDKEKQDLTAKYSQNAVFLELGGSGLFYSVNYEYRLPISIPILLRAGASFVHIGENGSDAGISLFTMPITSSYLLSWGSHHLEMGIGFTWGYAWSALNKRQGAPLDDYWHMVGLLQFGYRFQPIGSGFIFRATFTPMYGGRRFAAIGRYVQWWGGVSAGWSF